MRSTYPTEGDLATFLEGLSLPIPDALPPLFPGAIDAAISAFEERTDHRPFLGDGTESLRSFDPPANRDSILFIDGLCGAPSLVQYQPAGAAAETLTERVDYWLEPANAISKGQPITQLRFRRSWSLPLRESLRQSILITGPWGYTQRLPALVFLALQEKAASNVWSQLKTGATKGILGWKDGDRSVDYGVETWAGLNDQWSGKDSNFERAVAEYRKLEF